MTGRGAGNCAGANRPEARQAAPDSNPGMVMGARFAGNCGRGWRHMFFATGKPGWLRFGAPAAAQSPESEKQLLKDQAEQMQRKLDSIHQRLGEMDSPPSQD